MAPILDIPRLRAALEDWPEQTATDPQQFVTLENSQSRAALLTARFINYVEGRNDLEPRSPAMTPEFELTAECCRWAFSGRDATKVHALCRMVDWPRFERTALFHRVHGLAWNCLYSIGADVPPAVARSLSGEPANRGKQPADSR